MQEELITMLEQKRFHELSRLLRDQTGPDIAALVDEIPAQYLPLVYRLLPKDLAADAFVSMDPDVQELLIAALSDSELQEVLTLLFVDDTVDIVEEMPANVVKRILQNSTADKRRQINEILRYPDDSAGSIMTTEYVDLRKDMVVAEAFAHIRATGLNKETIYTCYVTDENRMLLGLVTVRTMLLAAPGGDHGDEHHFRAHSGRPGGRRETVRQIRLSGPAGRGPGKQARRHRDL